MTPRLLLLQVASALVSLLGVLVVMREGIFGSGPSIALGEGLALLSIAAVYAWWLSPVVATASGVKGAALALVVIDLVWVFFAMGLASFFYCAFPACPTAAPFSDVSRYGSVVFGGLAGATAWRTYRAMPGPTQWAPAVTALALIVLSFVFQGMNTRTPGS